MVTLWSQQVISLNVDLQTEQKNYLRTCICVLTFNVEETFVCELSTLA